MLTGTVLINELVDELNELKLSTMAATLDDLYHKPGFLEMDRLTLIAELIGPQFQEKVSPSPVYGAWILKLYYRGSGIADLPEK